MTLAHGTDRLESARLVLRRVTPDDLPFFTRIHALPEVAENLYPEGRPRSPEETGKWLQYTLASYEQLALGYLAVLRKEDGALIGRCGLMDMEVESAAPERTIRRGWFGREGAPAGVALTFAHTMGEFGVVLMVGGNIPGVTRTVSIDIYDQVQATNYAAANQTALVLLGISFVVLALVYALNRRVWAIWPWK